ncbi:diaminopimelate decarboxylase [Ruminococcaceae bacterium YRB3002]|nr:diaminopimelate decarboxylase [Ruminococcaceae bacterium YRB3002]
MRSYLEATDFWGSASAEALASEFGTPLYVYNERIIRSNLKRLSGLITKYPYVTNYSIKANSNLYLLQIALEEGLSADAMSEGEMRLLLKAGFPPEKIFFVPNNVSADEMKFAVEHNIIVSLDSIDQLDLFGTINPGGKCSVRLNPGVGAGHHEKVVTAGKNTKFAITDDQLDEMFATAAKHDLRIVGINQHIGSLFMDPEPFLKSVVNLLEMAMKFDKLDFIDFGGGYGVPYHKVSEDEQPFDFDSFEKKFEALLDGFVEKAGYVPLFKTEPGRYAFCEGGVLLGRVHAVKTNADRKFAGTDIGMNVLARPTLYGSWHDVEIIHDNKVTTDDPEVITIVGNICESGDIIAKERLLPKITTGDLVCVLDAGAYGYAMASSYNVRRRPAEVLIQLDGTPKLIRRADTWEDLFRGFEI